PAPTTVILSTIASNQEFVGRLYHRLGKLWRAMRAVNARSPPLRTRAGASAPDLGEGQEPAGARGAPEHEKMPFRLDPQRLLDQRPQRFTAPQRIPKIRLDGAEQARAESAVRREAHAVAAVTIIVAHGRDDAHGARRAGEPEVGGRPVPGRARDRLQL